MKEGCFKFPVGMIIDWVALKDFIQLLKDECPETIDRSIVEYLVKNVTNPMEVWLDDVAVELQKIHQWSVI